jgi:hypothetical protein
MRRELRPLVLQSLFGTRCSIISLELYPYSHPLTFLLHLAARESMTPNTDNISLS